MPCAPVCPAGLPLLCPGHWDLGPATLLSCAPRGSSAASSFASGAASTPELQTPQAHPPPALWVPSVLQSFLFWHWVPSQGTLRGARLRPQTALPSDVSCRHWVPRSPVRLSCLSSKSGSPPQICCHASRRQEGILLAFAARS